MAEQGALKFRVILSGGKKLGSHFILGLKVKSFSSQLVRTLKNYRS